MNQQLNKIQARLGRGYLFVVIGLMSILVFLVGYEDVQPKQYDFRLNQVAQETIQAPVTLEDKAQTELNQQRARDSVADVYVFQPDIKDQQVTKLEDFFNQTRQIRKGEYRPKDLADLADQVSSSQLVVNMINNLMKATERKEDLISFLELDPMIQRMIFDVRFMQDEELAPIAEGLTNTSINALLTMSQEDLIDLQATLLGILSELLSQEINPGQVNEQVAQLDDRIGQSADSLTESNIMKQLLASLVVPTMVYSSTETNNLRDQAAMAVQPAYVLQGQVIVQEGHIINENNLHQLDLYGYLDESGSSITSYVFYCLIFIHAILLLYLLTDGFKWSNINLAKQNREGTIYCLSFSVAFFALKLFQQMELSGLDQVFLVYPVALLPAVIGKYGQSRYAVLAVFIFNLLGQFLIYEGDNTSSALLVAVFYFLSCLTTIIMLIWPHQHIQRRQNIIFIVIHLLIAVSLVASFNLSLSSHSALLNIAMMTLNAVLALILWTAFDPYVEQVFSDRARISLNQLASMNHPLFSELISVAPGTYNHSVMVAHIAANAVEAIEGDSLLTRVACYYHDIGKVTHPLFFTENVPYDYESPHQMLSAEESAEIIIGHVTQGVKILDENHFPQAIIDICKEHHGTTLVKYFYHQAKQEDPTVNDENFRYPGPKPQSKESAVIMIADSVEAASRSMKEVNQASIEDLVDKIIHGKLAERQFDESGLTVAELQIVRQSIITNLAGMNHTRIEYPD